MSREDTFTSTVDAAAAFEQCRALADYDPSDHGEPTPGEAEAEAFFDAVDAHYPARPGRTRRPTRTAA